MDPIYQRALHPDGGHRCFRQWLVPLTLDHWFLLHWFTPKLLNSRAEITLPDVRTAVVICSRSSRFARWALSGGLLARAWVWLYGRLWGWLCRNSDQRHEASAFFEYLAFHVSYPAQAIESGVETRTLNAPEPWRLLVMLMKDYGMSRKQAMRTPVLFAHVLWAVDADRDGRIRLVDQNPESLDRRDALLEYAREQDRMKFGAS